MRFDGPWGYFEVYQHEGEITITLPSSISVTPQRARDFAQAIIDAANGRSPDAIPHS